MTTNEKYMQRCLDLARLGLGSVAPNPLVGCVIVHNNKIIGEGFHQKYGQPHAEVNAIKSVKNTELLQNSTLYVTLEPCAHHGKTPPCSDLIVEKKIRKVVIGTVDPFAKVAGKGIEKLKKGGIEVELGVLEKECRQINRRFFTFHEKQRPYIILKWAQTLDGFLDVDRTEKDFGEPTWITGDLALRLVHKIRSGEESILVGTNTAQKDNPSLTVRHWKGRNPLRVVVDKNLRLQKKLHLFDQSAKTVVFTALQNENRENLSFSKIDFNQNIIPQILNELVRREILSVIVEGGKQLLESFIEAGMWDEAHIFFGNTFFYNGVRAPQIKGRVSSQEMLDSDKLVILQNS
ncbi:MAG: bifunctional diaminohydroxyphosphoribosylaminopyrimidine deaminase/5-amino-6-(5-phosphoribosylamino)uracil reductase RibD [Prolixibacteraceae bacterium]|nr:bifunctional diaminohydroxyphosphoribosylaminopyrimidine deaminase/5-amino-6-(5-phosphoribosylamino)uracil reductase RibD [Prolixibacteraceae bacterium]